MTRLPKMLISIALERAMTASSPIKDNRALCLVFASG